MARVAAHRDVQRHRLTWRKMMRIAERWLPSPKLRQPYPDWRFDVMARDVARCVSSARRDLCGGRRVISVPTATPRFQ
jgi:RNA-directed DNA polymerase